jgi:Ethanolamine utilization protein EutJ (predicted chaperonin)
MLKKTTVYLSDEDIALLRKKAAVRHITVAEAIRMSIQEACQPKTKEEKDIWNSLDNIWAKMADVPASKVESAVNKAVKEVRSGKKARRRP